jgi:hypothetical protein
MAIRLTPNSKLGDAREELPERHLANHVIPEIYIPQLAEFSYNLTTCPIPKIERISFVRIL